MTMIPERTHRRTYHKRVIVVIGQAQNTFIPLDIEKRDIKTVRLSVHPAASRNLANKGRKAIRETICER